MDPVEPVGHRSPATNLKLEVRHARHINVFEQEVSIEG